MKHTDIGTPQSSTIGDKQSQSICNVKKLLDVRRMGIVVLHVGNREYDCQRHADGLYVVDPNRAHPVPLAMWHDAERAARVRDGMRVHKLIRAAVA